MALFPPRQRRAFHKAVLDEILEERVVSSRNRRNPRGVKRKMSNFPLRPQHIKPLPPIVGIEDGSRQSIDWFGTLDSLKAIIDYPQGLPIGLVPPVSRRGIHEIGRAHA